MKNALERNINQSIPRYLDLLKALVSIPSISFDNFDQKFVEDSANAVKSLFEKAGFQNIQFLRPPSGEYRFPSSVRNKRAAARSGHPLG